MNQTPAPSGISPVQRVRAWYALLLIVFGLFALRVFYLQVIRYDYYKKAAQSDQLKEYTVQAPRGIITAQLGDSTVPIVLNQKLYTLYADPTLVKHADTVANTLQRIIGGNSSDIQSALQSKDTRYVVLKRKLTPAQSDAVLANKFAGVGTQEQDYRTYPQGTLASQLLGFVNNDGNGTYGLEQAMNKQLSGTPGLLKAVTDINGVPLAASTKNLSKQPVAGDNVQLTVNVGMQMQLEKILKAAAESNKSKGVSAVIMDVHTGAVKAMANYPTYDPANYQNVADPNLFQNNAVDEPIETGSIMKVLTTSAALQEHVITPTSTFYDPGTWTIDGATVSDVAEDHSTGQQSIESTLNLSLNTGAVWMLKQLGGGDINQKARNTLYDYFSNHFQLGKPTNIEQGYDPSGTVQGPTDNGSAINLTYANMSFGQAITASALQMDAAFSSVLNGGTYYQPYLVDKFTSGDGNVVQAGPKTIKKNVVSPQVSNDIVSLLEQVNDGHIAEGFSYLNFGSQYSVGGKTGSAQLALPGGGYSATDFNATYLGFVGGDTPQYAIAVYNFQPKISYGFVGAQAAQPIFANIGHMLVNDYGVTPRSH